MSLAGGGLGLSITFVHEIAPHPVHTGRLVTAWLLMLVSLIAVFVSLLSTRGTLWRRIKTLDDEKTWGYSILGAITTGLGWVAGTCLVISIVFLFLFAHANL